MGAMDLTTVPSAVLGFITDIALNYLLDGNKNEPEEDLDKNLFGVGGNVFPDGWNTNRPLFMDQGVGFDCPLVDGVVMARLVQRFIEHPDIYIAEFFRYQSAGCTFGQWWCQKMPFSAISFYSRFDLVAALYAVHDWGGGVRSVVGDMPCPFAGGDQDHHTRDGILERLSVYCLPSWWEGDFGKTFYNQNMLKFWWLRRAFATGWGFSWGDDGFWHTFQAQLISPDDLGLLLWIMAFMHQLMIIRTARHCFCLPTKANDDDWLA